MNNVYCHGTSLSLKTSSDAEGVRLVKIFRSKFPEVDFRKEGRCVTIRYIPENSDMSGMLYRIFDTAKTLSGRSFSGKILLEEEGFPPKELVFKEGILQKE